MNNDALAWSMRLPDGKKGNRVFLIWDRFVVHFDDENTRAMGYDWGTPKDAVDDANTDTRHLEGKGWTLAQPPATRTLTRAEIATIRRVAAADLDVETPQVLRDLLEDKFWEPYPPQLLDEEVTDDD